MAVPIVNPGGPIRRKKVVVIVRRRGCGRGPVVIKRRKGLHPLGAA